MLKTVLFLYNFLEEHHEHPSYKNLIFVNKMQTVLRLKEAYSYDSSDEKNQIVKFKIQAIKNNEDNVDLLFCLDTLLSNSPEAKHHFESFDDDKKQSFTSLPIFHMYNKLIDS